MSWWARRRSPFRDGMPPALRPVMARSVPHWSALAREEQLALESIACELLVHNRWEAARGFELTDEMRVTIAAQAALLVLSLGSGAYRDVGTIIVHPTTMRFSHERAGPVPGTRTDGIDVLLGLARYNGPVVIAWDAARAGARDADRGHNVVYHEFAHKLDMLDHLIDGTPPLETDLMERWVEVCTAAYESLRRGGDPLLDDYAGVSPAEFFAVATEVFFTRPLELADTKPDLYDVLRAFYRQDPAGRLRDADHC